MPDNQAIRHGISFSKHTPVFMFHNFYEQFMYQNVKFENARNRSPKWAYYYCNIDGFPSIISTDLSRANQAPSPRFHQLFSLSIKISNTDEQGFPNPKELGALCRLEDKLLAAFSGERFVFVGRVSTNGCRDFIFYTNKPLALKRKSTELMQFFPQYSFEMGSKPDLDWEFYFSFLFPNEKELNEMLNKRLLDRLLAKWELQKKAEFGLEHQMFFPNEAERNQFILQAIDNYFRVEEIGLDGDSPTHPWLLRISRPETLELGHINQLTMELIFSVKDYAGVYDGWQVQKELG